MSFLSAKSWYAAHSVGTNGSFSHNDSKRKFSAVITSVGVGVGVALTVGVGVGVGVATGVGVGDATGTGLAIATPLFHTNFLPLFTHVYFLPLYVEVAPALEHLAPGVTAATEICAVISESDRTATRPAKSLRIVKM